MKCKSTNQKVSEHSEFYSYVEDLAERQVYFGSITGLKTSPIFNLYLAHSCTEDDQKGYVFRFQTWAKPTQRSKEKLYYCYSKVVDHRPGVRRNHGTYCSPSLNKNINTEEFMFNTPSDPYSTETYTQRTERSPDYDRLEDEFNHSINRGIDQGFDPFYDTTHRNSDGPDSRDGSPL